MTLDEYEMIFNILVANYDVWKCYDYLKSNKWDGWKPTDYTDVLRVIGELKESITKNFNKRMRSHKYHYCTTAGLIVGITEDDYCYISSTFHNSMLHVRRLSDILPNEVYSYVNYKQTLRLIKIISIRNS